MDLECEEPARNISLHLFAGSQQQVTGQARVISSLNENPSQVQGLVIDCSLPLLHHQSTPCNWLLSINVQHIKMQEAVLS